MSSHQEQDAPSPPAAQHECIGCVCPGHGVHPVAERMTHGEVPAAGIGEPLPDAAAPPPDTPPPRA